MYHRASILKTTFIVTQLSGLFVLFLLSMIIIILERRVEIPLFFTHQEQYVFTHDALLEHIESGDTEVKGSDLTQYILTLQEATDEDENVHCNFPA